MGLDVIRSSALIPRALVTGISSKLGSICYLCLVKKSSSGQQKKEGLLWVRWMQCLQVLTGVAVTATGCQVLLGFCVVCRGEQTGDKKCWGPNSTFRNLLPEMATGHATDGTSEHFNQILVGRTNVLFLSRNSASRFKCLHTIPHPSLLATTRPIRILFLLWLVQFLPWYRFEF